MAKTLTLYGVLCSIFILPTFLSANNFSPKENDLNNCIGPILNPIIVTDNSGTPNDNAACHNGDLGLEAVVGSGGTAPFSFNWTADPAANVNFVDPSVSLTGANFQNTTDDAIDVEIKVVVTDSDGCTGTATVIITIAPDLGFTILKIENSGPVPNDGVVCFDDEVSLEPDGLPNGLLTYLWSTNETSETITVNPPNTNSNTNYTVAVTDSYGCSNQGLAGVTGISEVTSSISYKPACDPATDPDSVVVVVTGGVAPYQFVVNNAPFGIQNIPWTFPTFLPPGNDVIVEAMETNGCEAPTQTLTLPANPGALMATTIIANQTCDDLGSVDLTITGGTPPYTYLWSNGATTEDLTDVTADLYTIEISDAFDCEVSHDALVELDVNWTWYEDADGDTYGNANSSFNTCEPIPGYVLENDEDCDDSDPLEFPGQTWYLDMDGDYYSDGTSVTACERQPNYLVYSELNSPDDDCDDANAAIYPNATETCNNLDDDCNGIVDDGLPFYDWYFDGDSDGYGAGTPIHACEPPGSGHTTQGGDCDDNNPNVNPGVPEVSCNGIDDNCNNEVDEGSNPITWWADWDGDGYGDPNNSTVSCVQPGDFVDNDDDCNDNAININPSATEICDGFDNNCDGNIDEGFDVDGDGFKTCQGDCDDNDPAVNPGAGETCDGIDNNCNAQVDEGYDNDGDGWTTCEGDCHDWDASIYPGATETCNWLDDDCDGQIDEEVQNTYYADWDDDGYGTSDISTQACSPPNGFVSNDDDCNDNAININPGETETCDGYDNNCDGVVDEGFDVDGDGYTTCQGDCDDNNAAIHPGATELCDGIDNDCDNETDEGLSSDWDGDGYTSIGSCSGSADDCNDWNPNINPGAHEVCNWQDDNCNGNIDEGIGDYWYRDADNDGFGDPNDVVQSCWYQWGRVKNDEDCDDNDGSVNPNATEVCDGIDNDCDGIVDNISSPDLIVYSANFPANVTPGETINISGTIKNQGDENAGQNRVYWWLSEDDVIDNNDHRLNNWRRWTNNIDAGETKNFSKNSKIPNSGWSGHNYLIFRADAEYHVSEGCEEDNNEAAFPIFIGNTFTGGGNGNGNRAITFSAVKNEFKTNLFWTANFEQEVLEMTVERSENGQTFTPLLEMPNLSIEANSTNLFEKTDSMPHEGDNYYRIQFKLADGSTAYTEARLITFPVLEPFEIVPNPASHFVNVRMERFAGKEVAVVLFDRFAREVYRLPIDKVENEWVRIDLSDSKFKDGLYVLSVIHKGRAISRRLVITKFD